MQAANIDCPMCQLTTTNKRGDGHKNLNSFVDFGYVAKGAVYSQTFAFPSHPSTEFSTVLQHSGAEGCFYPPAPTRHGSPTGVCPLEEPWCAGAVPSASPIESGMILDFDESTNLAQIGAFPVCSTMTIPMLGGSSTYRRGCRILFGVYA